MDYISEWFTLAGWYGADELGVEGWTFEGRILLPEDRLQVACRSLPKGFFQTKIRLADTTGNRKTCAWNSKGRPRKGRKRKNLACAVIYQNDFF